MALSGSLQILTASHGPKNPTRATFLMCTDQYDLAGAVTLSSMLKKAYLCYPL